jgi:hypothetical protein
MVNVLGVRCAADRALTSLSSQDLLKLSLSDLVLTAAIVMARQAVATVTFPTTLATRTVRCSKAASSRLAHTYGAGWCESQLTA